MSEVDSGAPNGAAADGELPDDALIGTVVADRYRIEEKLGEGGMGAVYRAEHVLMKKAVALKVLHREMTVMEEVVKRFKREAIAAGRIEHPNVTVATDFGKLEGGAFYLVLEYLPGRSLTQVLAADGALPPERAIFIARQVASALAAAHSAEIVHRDLKPDNIMLVERGGVSDFVKVLDFGIAKLAPEATGGQQLTRLGTVFGTPQYMAPEQAAGKSVDHRADLYALGLIMHEMLSGTPAFAAEEVVVLLTKQMTEPPPPLDDAIDPAIRRLVWKLLKKDPDERVQSSDEVVSELDVFLGGSVSIPESSVLGIPSSRGARSSQAVEERKADEAVDSMARTRLEPSDPEGGRADRPAVAEAATELHPGAVSGPVRAIQRRLMGASSSLRAAADVLKDSVEIRGRSVPLWMLGAAVGAFFMVLFLVVGAVTAGDEAEGEAGRVAGAAQDDGDSDTQQLLALASVGNREAMSEIEAVDEDDRSAAQWAALAEGRRKLGQALPALEAYHRALELDPKLSSDESLRVFVRRSVEKDETRAKALEIAAETMGAHGADLLFDVWASTSRVTDTTTAAKEWLDREEVREAASPSLSVALQLREAEGCKEFEKLLPRAKKHADRRSLRPLKQLERRRGCGFLQLNDCYACLRGGDTLSEAIGVAERTAPPRF